LTLVEVLVSVAILGAGTVLIMQAFVRGTYAITAAQKRLQAYTFSAAKMADLEMARRQGEDPKSSGAFRMGRDQFSWSVQRALAFGDPELELATLTVAWRQGRHEYSTTLDAVARIPIEEP